jgi:hypothetical protein
VVYHRGCTYCHRFIIVRVWLAKTEDKDQWKTRSPLGRFQGAALIDILHSRQTQAAPWNSQKDSAASFGHPTPSKTLSPKGSKLFSSGLPQADTLHSPEPEPSLGRAAKAIVGQWWERREGDSLAWEADAKFPVHPASGARR